MEMVNNNDDNKITRNSVWAMFLWMPCSMTYLDIMARHTASRPCSPSCIHINFHDNQQEAALKQTNESIVSHVGAMTVLLVNLLLLLLLLRAVKE